MPCPKCGTRVVVRGDAATAAATHPAAAFEGRGMERSLAILEPAAGGSFADADFRLPSEEPAIIAEAAASGVTLPWWVVYAAGVGLTAAAAGGFVLGMWWAARAASG